eukprot:gene205-249_t
MTKTALLIIDVQNDFMQGGSLEVAKANEILPLINTLRDSKTFDLVVLSQDWHPSDHMSFASNNPGKKVFDVIPHLETTQILWPNHCVQGSFGSEFHKDLKRVDGDVVVQKGDNVMVDSYSAFQDNDRMKKTTLEAILREHSIDTVYVCGIATDYCVAYTAIDAVNAGFKTHLLVDACRGVDPSTTSAQLEALRSLNVLLQGYYDADSETSMHQEFVAENIQPYGPMADTLYLWCDAIFTLLSVRFDDPMDDDEEMDDDNNEE